MKFKIYRNLFIKAISETEKGIYKVEKQSVKDYVINLKQEGIHNLIETKSAFLGADWSTQKVLDFIDTADQIAVVTNEVETHFLDHPLRIIKNNELYFFELGEIDKNQIIEN